MLSATQIPKDGVGKEKTIYGSLVRLKAKTLQKDKTTTLKITGMTSGAVKYVKNVDLSWAKEDLSKLTQQYTNRDYILIFPFCSKIMRKS